MRKLLLGVAAALVAAVAALSPASPASADPYAGVGVFVGTASTPSGLWFPASPFCPGTVPCPNTSGWSFSSATDVIVSTTVNPGPGSGRISGSGSLFGYCGGSVGTGTATIEGHSTPITFATAGGTGVLVGLGTGGHTAGALAATFQARPLPKFVGDVPCLTSAATDFLIVGAGAGGAA